MDINSFALGYSAGKKKGGGVELNIAYGDTPPEDTSKLWVKTTKPQKVLVTDDIETASDYKIEEVSSAKDPRINGAYCVYDNKIYVFGGALWSNITVQNTIAYYDILTKTYTKLTATLPEALYCASVARSGSNIYIVGGVKDPNGIYGRTKNIYRFNAETLEISALSTTINLPTYYYTRFSCAEASKTYIFATAGASNTTGNLLCFDAETEKVTVVLADYPKDGFNDGIQRSEMGVYDGHRYLYYGNKTPGITRIDTTTWEMNTFAVTESFRFPRCFSVVGNYLFVSKNNAPNRAPMYRMVDLKTGEVTTIAKDFFGGDNSLYDGSSVTVGSKIYIMPCYKSSSSSAESNAIYTFSPPVTDFDLTTGTLLIVPSKENNTIPIINSETTKIEIGVYSVFKGNAEGKGEKAESAIYKDGNWTTI